MLVLDGAALARQEEGKFAGRVARLVAQKGYAPVLATILVGNDPASATYVRMKGNACRRVGLESLPIHLPEDTATDRLLAEIEKLNADERVCGILLQHPVPAQIDERRCFDAIALAKDVDGVGSEGFGRMSMQLKAFGSATPAGIMRLLGHYGVEVAGKHAVVVGRSPILGRPMAMMLLNANATVTICHRQTANLPEMVGQADILVAALGRPRFIQRDWIRKGAVVVDAGYHSAEKCGDVDLEGVEKVASAYTPVPGGVGPMTINTLILQTIAAAERG